MCIPLQTNQTHGLSLMKIPLASSPIGFHRDAHSVAIYPEEGTGIAIMNFDEVANCFDEVANCFDEVANCFDEVANHFNEVSYCLCFCY